MIEGLDSLLATGVGVGGGSITVGWVAKTLITRYLKENDKKHEQATREIAKARQVQRQAFDAFSDKLSSIKTDIAVIKSRMGEVINVRDDVKENSRDVAVALERIEQNAEDIDEGFASLRKAQRRIVEQLDEIKDKKAG